jgi:hypothetical protein
MHSERPLLLRKFLDHGVKEKPKSLLQTVDPRRSKREAEAIRSKEGIPLIKPVVGGLLDISRKTGIPFEVK